MSPGGLIVDLFCGGGGASTGIKAALGRAPDIAVDHDPASIRMHAANHPETLHLCRSVHEVPPAATVDGRDVGLLWLSPDCTHFSQARGGKVCKQSIRDLAWVGVRWARDVRPRVICLENVPRFVTWGPLDAGGRPDKSREGETFREFVSRLRGLGYAVDWGVLNAADYGAPTRRQRLFLVARCDGQPVAWPTPTHGPGRAPYLAAGGCIDWTIPAPSIFTRKRPLAEKTMARIAEGLRRYVLQAADPWLVPPDRVATMIQTGYGERPGQRPRALDLRKPLGTVVAGGAKRAVVTAWLTGCGGLSASSDRVAAFMAKYCRTEQAGLLFDPLHTIVKKARSGLVTVAIDGEPWTVADVGMRMLQPRELATAQGFPPDYILTGTKTNQIARIGNSVPPPVAAAIMRAQFKSQTRRPSNARTAGHQDPTTDLCSV